MAPSVLGAGIDGGLDSRLRGKDGLLGALVACFLAMWQLRRVDGGLDSRLRGSGGLRPVPVERVATRIGRQSAVKSVDSLWLGVAG